VTGWSQEALEVFADFSVLNGANAAQAMLQRLLVTKGFAAGAVEETFEILGSKVPSWPDSAIDGFVRVISDNGSSGVQRLAGFYSDSVLVDAFDILGRRQTQAWPDASVEGVVRLVHRLDASPGRSAVQAEYVLQVTGGSNTGARLFRLIQEADVTNANGGLTGWPGFVSEISNLPGPVDDLGKVKGRVHVLFYIENNGGFQVFNRLEGRVPGILSPQRTYDAIDSTGIFYEFKNIEHMRTDQYDQMIDDLFIFSDRANPRDFDKLRWVFRGTANTNLMSALQNCPHPLRSLSRWERGNRASGGVRCSCRFVIRLV